MKVKRCLLVIVILCMVGIFYAYAQDKETFFSETFISPVKHKVRLTGSFGELRKNHFHTGIDIKKYNPDGDSLFAVMSGYVSRLRMQSGSYGKSVYITHPNGTTSVYAHLEEYEKNIQKKIQDKQRQLETFEIDYYLPSDAIPVNQGDYIGMLGNTGRSSGPHLHFEIRNTKTELAINPQLYDFGVKDSKAPVLEKFIIHDLDSNFQILEKAILPPSTKSHTTKSKYIGIGFKGFDQMDGLSNKNGIADIKVYVDNRLNYYASYDTISFYEMKYINAIIDYEEKIVNNSTYYMCYQLPENKSRNIKKAVEGGLINIDKATDIRIVLKDLSGNRNIYSLKIVPDNPSQNSLVSRRSKGDEKIGLDPKIAHTLRSKNAQVTLKPGTIYKRDQVDLKYNPGAKSLQVSSQSTPCQKYYDLQISGITDPKMCLYHKDISGKSYNVGGSVSLDTFRCNVNRFGSFYLKADRTPPTIRFANKTDKKLKFWIKDDTNVAGKTPEVRIKCTTNGKWIPYYYKSMTHLMEINLSDLEGSELMIEVSDYKQNKKILKYPL